MVNKPISRFNFPKHVPLFHMFLSTFGRVYRRPPKDAILKRYKSSQQDRFNAVNIQMLPESIRNHLFLRAKSRPASSQLNASSFSALSRRHLELQRLLGKKTTTLKDPGLVVPPLLGGTLHEHFMRMAYVSYREYFDLARQILRSDHGAGSTYKVSEKPSKWVMDRPGWTRYLPEGGTCQVPYPDERVMIFDVEVLASETKYPILAIAYSPGGWYSWLSPALFSQKATHDSPKTKGDEVFNHLIPMGKSEKERLIIGHNVSYDRARILEEYDIRGSQLRFLDTMSLHMAVSGLTSDQRVTWKKIHKVQTTPDSSASTSAKDTVDTGEDMPEFDASDLDWFQTSSLNGLKDVAAFYLGVKVDKSKRDVFVVGTLEEVKQQLPDLMNYCAQDVDITHQVFSKVFPKFWETKVQGNLVSLGGVLEMGSSFLPVSPRWNDYIDTCEKKADEVQKDVLTRLRQLAENLLHSSEEFRRTDHYARQLDWTPVKRKGGVIQPRWYRQLIPSKQNEPVITIRTGITPLLLRMTWCKYPLYHLGSVYGWCYRVPKFEQHAGEPLNIEDFEYEVQQKITKSKSGKTSQSRYLGILKNDPEGQYFRLPSNQSGPGASINCGSPLAKQYLRHFASGDLSSDDPVARQALESNSSCSYWIATRGRVIDQFVIRPKDLGLTDANYGVIIPRLVTMGTVTRRAVEPTWLTASNAKKNRIGSELKSLIIAPEGYALVGADVDSQELWISSLLGDAQFGIHGATAFGWMTLQGTKADKTDLHSRSAEIIQSSRDHAKVFNYARIYGSGLKFASELLLKFNPTLTVEEAKRRAQNLYDETKGLRYFPSRKMAKWQLSPYAQEIFDKLSHSFWYGGTESFMFNALERIASSADPRTPACRVQLPDSLLPETARKKYHTSCVNWVVQSSGVDYLHLLLVSMRYLMKRYEIDGRLLITIHDEIRYLVKKEDAHRLALALQISNLWTRSYFAYMQNFDDLPLSVAFFSAVDIDHVLRKEATDPCVTPSNPQGISEFGEGLTIYDLIARVGSELKRPDGSTPPDEPLDIEVSEPPLEVNTISRKAQELWLSLQMSQNRPDITSKIYKKY